MKIGFPLEYSTTVIEEFENFATPEARFARAMDNFQPLLLNDSNDGGDWVEHEVSKTQVMKRQCRTWLGSEVIGAYTEQMIEENIRKGYIKDE